MTPAHRAFILSLDADGLLTPADVLAAAEPEDSPIHGLFTWDDSIAGARFRMDEARTIIRRIRVNYIPSEPIARQIRVSEYIHNPELGRGEQGYVRAPLLRTRAEAANAALVAELSRVGAMVARARKVAVQIGKVDECEAGLREILGAVTAVVV